MANDIIRPSALETERTSPVASEFLVTDNGTSVAKVAIEKAVQAGRPAASKNEAEAGSDANKVMTPLTVQQKIDYEIGKSLASKAQGDKADTAVQPSDLGAVATSNDYDDLDNKPTLGTAASENVEAFATAEQGGKADTAIQSVVEGSGIGVDLTDPQNPVISYTGTDGVSDGDKGDVIVSDNGAKWQLTRALVYPASPAPAVFDAGNRRIGVVADPIDDQDAVNRRSALVNIGGAFVAGGLQIAGLADGSALDHAATLRQAKGKHQVITLPTGFDWPSNGAPYIGREPFTVIKDRAGNYNSSFSLRHAPSLTNGGATGTKRFLAPFGNNSNSGLTPQEPKATLDNAFTATGALEFELGPGNYVNAWTGDTGRNFAHIYCRDGKARLIIGQIPSNWTSVGSGVYSANVGTTYVITAVNDRQSDEFGFPLALPRYADLAALQASNSFGYAHVGSTLYIRLRDDGGGYPVPGGGEIIVPQRGSSLTYGPLINSGSRFLLENLEIWGGDLGMMLNGVTGSTGTMFAGFINCDFAFSYSNGVSMYNTRGGAWFKNCRAFRNRADGFNGHDDGAGSRSIWIEDHCISLGNGFNSTTNANQGSTNHDNGRCIRIGGFYGFGKGQAIADVGGSQSFNLGCTLDGSVSASDKMGLQITDTAEAWIDDCYVGGEDYSLRASDSSIIRIRDSILAGDTLEEGSGQILSY